MKKYLFFGALLYSVSAAFPVSSFADTRTVTIRSEAAIPNIFELTISKSGQSELAFGSIVSSGTPTKVGPITIVVSVSSNTGVPYQIIQFLNGPLENANGDKIGQENLQFITSSAKSTGTVITTPLAGSVSPETIYVSNETGASDTISAQYWLTPPSFQPPGSYSTLLTYTASAL